MDETSGKKKGRMHCRSGGKEGKKEKEKN